MIIQHQDAAHHVINTAAIFIPVASWLAHAPEFFTATAGACGTAWYLMIFAKEFLKWRKKRREGK